MIALTWKVRRMANEIIVALQASELFGDLPQKQLKRIFDAGKEMTFPAGADVVAEGDDAGRFFLILDGTAEVLAHGVHRAELGPGDAMGEIALLDGGPRLATVKAVSDVRTFSLASWNFRTFLGEPEVMNAVIGVLCRRLRSAEASEAK
jgi:CRP/FNR family transcriptional regulator, cyclic AMP receptor protein